VPDRPEVVLVKLREIKSKIDRRTSAKDRSNNMVSTKDVVRVVEGACKVCTFLYLLLDVYELILLEQHFLFIPVHLLFIIFYSN
jgi:hypothetical protein